MRNQRMQPGSAAFRERVASREAALGLADDTPAQRVTRAERAMEQAFWNFEMAERRHQSARVLDQMEDRYFAALRLYEQEMGATR